MSNELNSKNISNNPEIYNEYLNTLNQMEELENTMADNCPTNLFTIKGVARPKTNNLLSFIFDFKEDTNLFILTDNGLNFKDIKIDKETKDHINDYLQGSQVCINYENNVVYLKLGTLEEKFNLHFLCKQFIDCLTYINNLLK